MSNTTDGFHDILITSGIKLAILHSRSPDLNCYAERFVKSVKSECLDHLILSSVEQLDFTLRQYGEYYHHEHIHQSLGRIIEPKHILDPAAEIVCLERLGGLLKSYHRLAA
jgi:putative transposase